MKLVIFDLDDTLYDKTKQVGLDVPDNYDLIQDITPFPGIIELIKSSNFIPAIVTKGNSDYQSTKIKNLNLDFIKDVLIVNTNEEKKQSFQKLIRKYNPDKTFVVGDRPEGEIYQGNKLSLETVRVLTGRYANIKPKNDFEKAKFEIKNVVEIKELI